MAKPTALKQPDCVQRKRTPTLPNKAREHGLFAHHLTSWKTAFCADGREMPSGKVELRQLKDENAITPLKDKTTDPPTIVKDDKKDLKIEGSKTDNKTLQKMDKPGVATKPEDKTKMPIQKTPKSGNDY